MKPDDHISDELLNSFIDHQITNDERQEILSLVKHDRKLANRICELQRIKEMTSTAFDDIPASLLPETVIPRSNKLPRLAAAIAIFCLGALLGLSGLHLNNTSESFQPVTAASGDTATRVLIHLTSSDSASALNTLNNLEQMLQDYRINNQPIRVEVVANGPGIKLLRQDTTPFAELISRLSREYDNLMFAACKNTIDLMQITEGRQIALIPEATLIGSGVVEVIQRQRQGWMYIRG